MKRDFHRNSFPDNSSFLWHIRKGRPDAALPFARLAYQSAVETDDERLIGLAVADMGIAFVLAGRGAEVVGPLSDWATVSTDPYVRYRLLRTLATHHRQLDIPDWKKHQRFSQEAYDQAELSRLPTARAQARFEIAFTFTADDSRVSQAQEYFTDAVGLLTNWPDRSLLAPYLASLGNCLVRAGKVSGGVRTLSESIGIARSEAALLHEIAPRFYLANAMLEMRRPRDAEFHLRTILHLDRLVSQGRPWTARILHLLGDALKMQRRTKEAFQTFRKLQTEFFPGNGGLAEVLMEVDARRTINGW